MIPLIEPEPILPGRDNLAPTDEALGAVIAALEQYLGKPAATVAGPGRPGWRTSAGYPWRFSGRWWTGPAPLRRERPLR